MVHIVDRAELILAIISLIFLLLTQCAGIRIIYFFRKANRELVKAKLFLGDTLKWMWVYATLAGSLFVLNGALISLKVIWDVDFGLLNGIAQTLFTISFFLMSLSWYSLFKKGIQ
ncbi:MAG: hypothetical protein V3V92_00015 [Candidatus Hydrothermarchaeales archaeon]